MQTQGMLTVDELAELAHTGEIDTVLCMFTDLGTKNFNAPLV